MSLSMTRIHGEETKVVEEQLGFMQGTGTTDATFAVRQLTDKHREKQKELTLCYYVI